MFFFWEMLLIFTRPYLKSYPLKDLNLGETVQTWSELAEDFERLQVQVQMEELQRQQEKLKTELKTMSSIQKMQKDHDKNKLK